MEFAGSRIWIIGASAGIGAALLGSLADWTSIGFVYKLCSFLPAIGLLTMFLPNTRDLTVVTAEPAPAE